MTVEPVATSTNREEGETAMHTGATYLTLQPGTKTVPLLRELRHALEQDGNYCLVEVRTDGQRLQVQLVLCREG